MAYAHCHNCGWSQDDFWSEWGSGWHPLHKDVVQNWINYLNDAINGQTTIAMDIDWAKEAGVAFEEVDGSAEVRILDFVAYELECKARNIREMHWLTEKEFKNDPNRCCPKCGSKHLDVD